MNGYFQGHQRLHGERPKRSGHRTLFLSESVRCPNFSDQFRAFRVPFSLVKWNAERLFFELLLGTRNYPTLLPE